MVRDTIDYVSFLQSYIDRGTGIIVSLGTILGLIGEANDLVPDRYFTDFILLVLLSIVVVSHYHDWESTARTEKSIALLNEKEEVATDVVVADKRLDATISSEGMDRVVYTYTIEPASEDQEISKYIALIVSDNTELDWNDLNVTEEGCDLKEYGRYPGSNKVKFPIELELPEEAKPLTTPGSHTFSYTVVYDTLNPESDWVGTIIREPTNHIGMSITFPPGVSPDNRRAYEIRGEDHSPAEPEPYSEDVGNDQTKINWQRSGDDIEEGTTYVVTWGDFDVREIID